jgi:hypothetical protein
LKRAEFVLTLVDYANVDPLLKERGLEAIAWRICEVLGGAHLSGADRLRIRLYGGWYQGGELSKLAQGLAAELDASFPLPVRLPVGGSTLLIRVDCELARSLIIEPGRDLFHTFRERGLPGGIKTINLPFPGCPSPEACAIGPICAFLRNSECPADGCSVRPRQVMHRGEQKLVDTMLVADLIQVASHDDRVAVISSDDDIWPGIRTGVALGCDLIHLQSKRGQHTPEFYKTSMPANYFEGRLVD